MRLGRRALLSALSGACFERTPAAKFTIRLKPKVATKWPRFDIQEYLLGTRCAIFSVSWRATAQLVDWMWQAVAMWERAISDLRNSAPEEWPPSSYWIDWWAKLHLLQTYKDDCPDTTPDILSVLATEYHNIAAEKSLAQQMAHDGLLRQSYTAQQVASAANESSSHPRAQRRAYWIKSHSPGHKVSHARWEDVTVNGRLRILEFD
jgi:hypothetical protein